MLTAIRDRIARVQQSKYQRVKERLEVLEATNKAMEERREELQRRVQDAQKEQERTEAELAAAKLHVTCLLETNALLDLSARAAAESRARQDAEERAAREHEALNMNAAMSYLTAMQERATADEQRSTDVEQRAAALEARATATEAAVAAANKTVEEACQLARNPQDVFKVAGGAYISANATVDNLIELSHNAVKYDMGMQLLLADTKQKTAVARKEAAKARKRCAALERAAALDRQQEGASLQQANPVNEGGPQQAPAGGAMQQP